MDHPTITRDDFEAWAEQALQEALDRMSQQPRSLGAWTKTLAQTLMVLAAEQGGEDDDGIDNAFGYSDHVGGIFGDEDY